MYSIIIISTVIIDIIILFLMWFLNIEIIRLWFWTYEYQIWWVDRCCCYFDQQFSWVRFWKI